MARSAVFLLWLVLANPAASQSVFDIELPEPQDGFAWQILPEIKGAFLAPTGWHFKSVERPGTSAYFLSQEDIEERGSYDTGLSINAVRDLTARSGRPACGYAQAITALAGTQAGEEVLERSEGARAMFCTFTTRYRAVKPTGEAVVIHMLALGNPQTDTVYLVTFESPEATWEEAWSAGRVMTNRFVLDESI